eukprot:scaffold179_cov247-Pinguiococcus_pyrenoidosus.AAC.7
MVLSKGSLRTNELVRFGAAQNLIFAAGASNMHLRRQNVFWLSGMGHERWVVGGRLYGDTPPSRFDSADLARVGCIPIQQMEKMACLELSYQQRILIGA